MLLDSPPVVGSAIMIMIAVVELELQLMELELRIEACASPQATERSGDRLDSREVS